MKKALTFLVALLTPLSHAGNIVVIGHGSVPRLDVATIQKIYTGKVISVAGQNVTAVNAKTGMPIRNAFMQFYLGQDDDKYIAYWTVRRYIGKGTPPLELTSTAEILSYVQSTPGAIAYVDEADVPPGINVVGHNR